MGYSTDFTGAFGVTRLASPADAEIVEIAEDARKERRYADAARILNEASWQPGLLPHHAAYLHAFSNGRRMRRSTPIVTKRHDTLRLAAGIKTVGVEGGYYVAHHDVQFGMGPSNDDSVVDMNQPPKGQPGLWCQWEPTSDNNEIAWDGGEKFYYYTEWMQYLLKHFLVPWGYRVNGTVEWKGEDHNDVGRIVIVDNDLTVKLARLVFDE